MKLGAFDKLTGKQIWIMRVTRIILSIFTGKRKSTLKYLKLHGNRDNLFQIMQGIIVKM